MTPKQKTAIAALVVSALVAVSAMFAPGVKCEPDQTLIEDALGGENSSGPGPDVPAEQPAAPAESASSGPAASSSESSGSTGA